MLVLNWKFLSAEWMLCLVHPWFCQTKVWLKLWHLKLVGLGYEPQHILSAQTSIRVTKLVYCLLHLICTDKHGRLEGSRPGSATRMCSIFTMECIFKILILSGTWHSDSVVKVVMAQSLASCLLAVNLVICPQGIQAGIIISDCG